MAKVGNHGIIIPRNKRLMTRLYWKENRSMTEVAAIFGVNHRSIGNVFIELGIRRRKRRAKGQSRWFRCIDCGEPTHKIKHPINGSLYGTRCKNCRRLHYNMLAREYKKDPEINRKAKENLRRWYLNGAINPTGERQWLNKSKILLRNTRRLLLNPRSRAASESRNAVLKLERTLLTSCRQ